MAGLSQTAGPAYHSLMDASSTIRAAVPGDSGRIAEIYNHYVEASVVTFEEDAVSTAAMEQRIAEVTAGLPWLVWEEDSRISGYAYASKWKGRCAYRYSVESTVYLDERARGRGIGTALYERLLAELELLGMHAVIGGIALPNEASVRLHERLGFHRVARFPEVGFKFGRWVDVGYWQKILPGMPLQNPRTV